MTYKSLMLLITTALEGTLPQRKEINKGLVEREDVDVADALPHILPI